MNFLTISKILLIGLLPALLFLYVLNFTAFDESFYREKFAAYNVKQDVPEAVWLNEKVINFIKGKNNELPNEFNEREKQHLWDIRKFTVYFTIALYVFTILFMLLLTFSIIILKVNNILMNFIAKIMIFGGIVTVMLAVALSLSVILDFSTTFESFHKLFFEKGTYLFDPAKEMIVKLYPEQLFMELGIRILKWIILISTIIAFLGISLIFMSKNKKNKNRSK